MRIVWFVVILSVLVTGCHIQESTPQTISDTVTPYYVSETKDVPDDTILVENLIDEMDQGTFEYHSGEWGNLITAFDMTDNSSSFPGSRTSNGTTIRRSVFGSSVNVSFKASFTQAPKASSGIGSKVR